MKNKTQKSKVLVGALAFLTCASMAAGVVTAPVFATGEEEQSSECYEGVSVGGIPLPYLIPVGYKYEKYISFQSPECKESIGASYQADDDSIIGVEEKNSGVDSILAFEFTAKKAGETSVGLYSNIGGAGVAVRVYNATSNVFNSADEQTLLYELLVANYGHDANTGEDDTNALWQALENNESISVNLHVNDKTADEVDNDEKAKINAVLGGSKVLAYSDITLLVEGSESGEIGRFTDLGSGMGCYANGDDCFVVQNTINVKWGGLGLGKPAEGYKRNFYIIYVHDGEATKIPASVDKDGNVVFASGKFSTYAVAYEDVKISDDTTAKTPETGANTESNSKDAIISLVGCIVAGIAMAFTIMPRIRKQLAKNRE